MLLLIITSALLPSVVRAQPTLEDRIRASIMAPLVADSLSLATHYGLAHVLLSDRNCNWNQNVTYLIRMRSVHSMTEYDAVKIKQFYGVVDKYYAPGEKTGGQTHGVGWGTRNYHNGID